MKKFVAFFLFSQVVTAGLWAQSRSQPRSGTPAPVTAPVAPAAPRSGPRPFNEVITARARTTNGLFTVHRLDDKVYFEIPDSILSRDILVVSRLSKAAADMRAGGSMNGYAGDHLNSSVVRFEKGPNNKLFMRDLSYSERSDSIQPMYQAVQGSTVQPIVSSFDVRAFKTDSITKVKSTLIEMTDVLNSDNDVFFFGPSKTSFRIGMYQADKSYLVDVKSFPINTEIVTVKTYGRAPAPSFGGMPAAPSGGAFTVEINTSMVLLARKPMKPRFFDPRVGYFTEGYTDYDANPQGVKQLAMATRWRLEPKEEDIEKYKRGELVEPKKPIVIYIDPATPSKWVPYLIQGVNDWQPAFEKAGFKNAIVAKKAPTMVDDSTWSLYDARHSAIVYKPSAVPNASGPHTADPRSGEIIETHINWYHNVMKLIHDWYLIQAAPIDQKARHMQFDDDLMGQLIRFVSSHEVGHTLGLRHNFGSSSTTPVEKLRDKKWVEAHGHTPSIMDYARFNYVAQPEDSIGAAGIFPRIGDYDNWAIEWGYRWFPENMTATEEKALLNKMTIEKLKDKRYWFGTEMDPDDPRAQNEDLGDNAMKASEYGIKNLKRVAAQLPQWTREENEGYDNLKAMYNQLFTQMNRYVGHVSKNIAGRYETLKTVEQQGAVYEPVPAATQKEAMSFLTKEVFTTPGWLIDKKILDLTGGNPASIVLGLQSGALNRLMDAGTINKLIVAESQYPKSYKALDYLKDLEKGIWSELKVNKPIDLYRRNLQKEYVARFNYILHPPVQQAGGMARSSSYANTDAVSVVRAHLTSLKASIQTALPLVTDAMTKYHLVDMLARINESLKTGKSDG